MLTPNRLAVTALLLTPLCAAAAAEFKGSDEWQLRRLFEPTRAELTQEADGRVVIYDGLNTAQVEAALDSEFHRMEHTMFIRTRHTQPDGQEAVEDDDGC